jgi:alkane 1-monooxygenase
MQWPARLLVNYVEHYGLLRQKDALNRYVRCEPEHSWNSNHIVGNILLCHLQRGAIQSGAL